MTAIIGKQAMRYRCTRRAALRALFSCLILPAACTPGGMTGAPPLFIPESASGVTALSESAAASLATGMNARAQGMDSWRELSLAVAHSLAWASARPEEERAPAPPGIQLSYGQLAVGLRHLLDLLPRLDDSPDLLAKDFTWLRIGPDFDFTGYYEPTLRACRAPSAACSHPLYRPPEDLRAGIPYYSRREIDREGALAGRNLEIAWVDSDIDAFFLHVQGSGRLLFPDGVVSHILYAAGNNLPYRSLGRILRERGLLAADNVNMPSIRRYLLEHPDTRAELLDANPSYVFFREAAHGPVGAMGRPLTPWVSVAADRRRLPFGSLLFAVLPLPDAVGKTAVPFRGLLLPQDAGGAITGQRLDLFCGAGARAAHCAGFLNARGAVHMLIRKQSGLRHTEARACRRYGQLSGLPEIPAAKQAKGELCSPCSPRDCNACSL
jgi:membrane-bound lytic murein transglycosylase A